MNKKWLGVVACAWATSSFAAPVLIDIDETVSDVTIELCVSGTCDDATSRVDGTVLIELDDYVTPTTLALHDFNLLMIDPVALNLDIFLLGKVDALGENLEANYAGAAPMAPVPLSGTAFTVLLVPADLAGTLMYEITGLLCDIATGAGFPCVDTLDLSSMGTQEMDSMSGDVSISGDTVTLTFGPSLTVPLDPDAPDLGSVSFRGAIVGTGTVPSGACPSLPGPVTGLMAVKDGLGGVSLSWEEELLSGGYRVYSVANKSELPPNGMNPLAVLECETLSGLDLWCDDPDPVAGTDRYYEVVGVCDGSEGAN